jgi:hypothetical protein
MLGGSSYFNQAVSAERGLYFSTAPSYQTAFLLLDHKELLAANWKPRPVTGLQSCPIGVNAVFCRLQL